MLKALCFIVILGAAAAAKEEYIFGALEDVETGDNLPIGTWCTKSWSHCKVREKTWKADVKRWAISYDHEHQGPRKYALSAHITNRHGVTHTVHEGPSLKVGSKHWHPKKSDHLYAVMKLPKIEENLLIEHINQFYEARDANEVAKNIQKERGAQHQKMGEGLLNLELGIQEGVGAPRCTDSKGKPIQSVNCHVEETFWEKECDDTFKCKNPPYCDRAAKRNYAKQMALCKQLLTEGVISVMDLEMMGAAALNITPKKELSFEQQLAQDEFFSQYPELAVQTVQMKWARKNEENGQMVEESVFMPLEFLLQGGLMDTSAMHKKVSLNVDFKEVAQACMRWVKNLEWCKQQQTARKSWNMNALMSNIFHMEKGYQGKTWRAQLEMWFKVAFGEVFAEMQRKFYGNTSGFQHTSTYYYRQHHQHCEDFVHYWVIQAGVVDHADFVYYVNGDGRPQFTTSNQMHQDPGGNTGQKKVNRWDAFGSLISMQAAVNAYPCAAYVPSANSGTYVTATNRRPLKGAEWYGWQIDSNSLPKKDGNVYGGCFRPKYVLYREKQYGGFPKSAYIYNSQNQEMWENFPEKCYASTVDEGLKHYCKDLGGGSAKNKAKKYILKGYRNFFTVGGAYLIKKISKKLISYFGTAALVAVACKAGGQLLDKAIPLGIVTKIGGCLVGAIAALKLKATGIGMAMAAKISVIASALLAVLVVIIVIVLLYAWNRTDFAPGAEIEEPTYSVFLDSGYANAGRNDMGEQTRYVQYNEEDKLTGFNWIKYQKQACLYLRDNMQTCCNFGTCAKSINKTGVTNSLVDLPKSWLANVLKKFTGMPAGARLPEYHQQIPGLVKNYSGDCARVWVESSTPPMRCTLTKLESSRLRMTELAKAQKSKRKICEGDKTRRLEEQAGCWLTTDSLINGIQNNEAVCGNSEGDYDPITGQCMNWGWHMTYKCTIYGNAKDEKNWLYQPSCCSPNQLHWFINHYWRNICNYQAMKQKFQVQHNQVSCWWGGASTPVGFIANGDDSVSSTLQLVGHWHGRGGFKDMLWAPGCEWF